MAALRISPEKVCFVVVKARELDVKVAPEELGRGSSPTDDQMVQVLEDHADDPTFEELRSFLEALNEDELEDLRAVRARAPVGLRLSRGRSAPGSS